MGKRILISGHKFIENYIDAVEKAGGEPVAGYLPEIDLDCAGLILCGGVDVDPSRYGEALDGATDIDQDRDASEFALARAFIEAGKPVFGICRGSQLLNVYFGGTLHQHMFNTVLHRSGTDIDREHEVEAVPNSVIEQLYGKRFVVNSVHHQAIKTLGTDLTVTHRSDDGIIEGFQHNSLPIFAVQWHPERLVDQRKRNHCVDGGKLFRYFIELCK